MTISSIFTISVIMIMISIDSIFVYSLKLKQSKVFVSNMIKFRRMNDISNNWIDKRSKSQLMALSNNNDDSISNSNVNNNKIYSDSALTLNNTNDNDNYNYSNRPPKQMNILVRALSKLSNRIKSKIVLAVVKIGRLTEILSLQIKLFIVDKILLTKANKLNGRTRQRNTAVYQIYKSFINLLRPRNLLRITFLSISLLFLRDYIKYAKSLTMEIAYSQFLQIVTKTPERLSSISVTPSVLYFLLDGKSSLTRVVNLDKSLVSLFLQSGLDFSAASPPVNVFETLWNVCYVCFLIFLYRRMQGPKDETIGKSRDQMGLESFGSLSFEDVAGQDRAKLEVKEVCDMLRSPDQFAAVGARLPSGVLLTGPPGTGKTLLARVTAAEAKVPFFACSATEFVEIFVGRGPARIRKLFKVAAENSPCILFIDEIDSIGKSRRLGSMNSEQESSLNQLLTCMDGLDTSNNGVIVMAATNRAELLDPALLRPGRFDRIVQCPLPDKEGRLAILRVHSRKVSLDESVKLETIASMTGGLGGADLANLINESAIRAVRRGAITISQTDIYDALRSYFTSRGLSFPIVSDFKDWTDFIKKITIDR